MNQVNLNPVGTAVNRCSSQSTSVGVWADIYKDEVNISIWQRDLSIHLLNAAERVLDLNQTLQFSASVSSDDVFELLYQAMGATVDAHLISKDIHELVSMFCLLFDLDQVGLRLTALDRAMCPKFHVDRVPCRLVTTYSQIATEWLLHQNVDRSKLGLGSKGKTDKESGLYAKPDDIQQLNCGDVALLKGESWIGNEGGGLVHRSPNLINSKKRLLLTLDF